MMHGQKNIKLLKTKMRLAITLNQQGTSTLYSECFFKQLYPKDISTFIVILYT